MHGQSVDIQKKIWPENFEVEIIETAATKPPTPEHRKLSEIGDDHLENFSKKIEKNPAGFFYTSLYSCCPYRCCCKKWKSKGWHKKKERLPPGPITKSQKRFKSSSFVRDFDQSACFEVIDFVLDKCELNKKKKWWSIFRERQNPVPQSVLTAHNWKWGYYGLWKPTQTCGSLYRISRKLWTMFYANKFCLVCRYVGSHALFLDGYHRRFYPCIFSLDQRVC